MAHMIEEAKSGRARCRTCREPIGKGELRFGEETINAFSDGDMTYMWHHLACAAKKKPKELKTALDAFDGDIPDRKALEKQIAEGASKQKPGTFPYVEKAPTGRSKCLACDETIEKDTYRVAIEREVDAGGFVRKSAGYLHPACASEFVGDDELAEKLKANSNLKPAELDEVLQEL
jgi:poly [ADP-ribose] polymerase